MGVGGGPWVGLAAGVALGSVVALGAAVALAAADGTAVAAPIGVSVGGTNTVWVGLGGTAVVAALRDVALGLGAICVTVALAGVAVSSTLRGATPMVQARLATTKADKAANCPDRERG